MTVRFFEVGGCVRDEIMGLRPKDIDFSVEAPSFEAMKFEVETNLGMKVVVDKPEFNTLRCVAKRPFMGHTGGLDFVLCRIDGPSSDGRRPDWTAPGTLMDDLSRRDFTMNAIAKDEDGNIIDPFNGQQDIQARLIRAVGSAQDRLMEDALRGLRAMRFAITKDFQIDGEIVGVLRSPDFISALSSISKERQREEVEKMFATDTIRAMKMFGRLPSDFAKTVFSDGLRLSATMGK